MEWIAWILGVGALMQGGLFLFGYLNQPVFPLSCMLAASPAPIYSTASASALQTT